MDDNKDKDDLETFLQEMERRNALVDEVARRLAEKVVARVLGVLTMIPLAAIGLVGLIHTINNW